jgi:hypothetical protein
MDVLCPLLCPRQAWDDLGLHGDIKAKKSRKALISLGFTAFLGLPGKTNWWSRGDLNPRPPVLRCRFYMLSRVY